MHRELIQILPLNHSADKRSDWVRVYYGGPFQFTVQGRVPVERECRTPIKHIPSFLRDKNTYNVTSLDQ